MSQDPFPLETLFPGIHKVRPDIAAYEAETFLAHGYKPDGADLDDPAVRMRLLEGPGKFTPFQILPLRPSLAALVNALPPDWQERPECHAQAEAINDLTEKLYGLAPRYTVSVDEDREVWVHQKGWA